MDLDEDIEIKDELKEVQCARIAFQNFGKLTEMENTISTERSWDNMAFDVLVKIFSSFNIIELTSGVSQVCSSWRMACCDPIIWKTIDFGVMESNFIKIPSPPYIYVAGTFDKEFMKIMKIAMGLSRGNLSCLIFHVDFYIKDDQLQYIAERSPHLRRLVLPAWNRITKGGICKAVRSWPSLESLTMPSINDPVYILEEIAMSCKNFTQLKVMGPFNIVFAKAIASFLLKLKVLSLRCSLLNIEALDYILETLDGLEVLNISHCLFVEKLPFHGQKRHVKNLDESTVSKASHLRSFFTCEDMLCDLCERMSMDEGYMRWYKCEEGQWRKDEVTSLTY